MPFQVKCPSCSARLTLDEAFAGKKMRCGKCQQVFMAPQVPTPPTPVAPSPERIASPIAAGPPAPPPGPTGLDGKGQVSRPDRESAAKAPSSGSPDNPPRKPGRLGRRRWVLASLTLVALVGGMILYFVLRDPAQEEEPEKDDNRGGVTARSLQIKPPELPADTAVKDLPAPVADVAVGGNGRFLALHLPALRKIALFDINEARIVHYFPAPDNDVRIICGLETLVVALNDALLLQRWNLLTGEKEHTVPLPGYVRNLAMGSASRGPLLIQWGRPEVSLQSPLSLVDLVSLKQLHKGWAGGRFAEGSHIRASTDGTVFSSWRNSSPDGVVSYQLVESQLKPNQIFGLGGHAVPGPDGKLLFTSNGVTSSEAGDGTLRKREPVLAVPAVHGNTYLRFIPFQEGPDWAPKRQLKVAVHFAGDHRKLATLPDLDWAPPRDEFHHAQITFDKRFHLIPEAGVLVTLPQTNAQLILRKLDAAALEKVDDDVLRVTSRPPSSALPGSTFTYQMETVSKSGGLQYKFIASPPGMDLSPEGKITWEVPSGFDEKKADVIVAVTDKSGQEVFHSFPVRIGAETAKLQPLSSIRLPVHLPIKDKFGEAPKEPDVPAGPLPFVAPPDLTHLDLKPPAFEGDKLTRSLPAAVTDVVVGGAGRFLLFHLEKTQQIAVFDVNEARVVKYLSLPTAKVKIAAGLEKLVVLLPGEKKIQLWDLTTLKHESTTALPITQTPTGIAMGSASHGPLAIGCSGDPMGGELVFVDIRSMKKLEYPGLRSQKITSESGLWCDPIGQTFALNGSRGGTVVVRQGSIVKTCSGARLSSIQTCAIPGPDGRTLFTGWGLRTLDLHKSIEHQFLTVPATSGNFYLGVHKASHPPDKMRYDGSIRMAGDERVAVNLGDLGLGILNPFVKDTIPTEKRFHLIPEAKVLVTVPLSDDKIDIQRVDLDQIAEKSGVDYLYVESRAPLFAVRGADFRYPIRVKSKKGGLTYRLDAGPAGMTLSTDGVLAWSVQKDFVEKDADVIVSITDSTGQDKYHTFRLALLDDAPAASKTVAKKDPAREPDKKATVEEPPIDARPDPLSIVPPKLEAGMVVHETSTFISSAVAGGGGRFILLGLKDEAKIALLDINEAKVVHYFEIGSKDFLFTAGMSKLVVLQPTEKVIHRYDLLSREKEKSQKLAIPQEPQMILMGYASEGLILVAGKNADGQERKSNSFAFLHLESLEPADVTVKDMGYRTFAAGFTWASADGKVFGSGTHFLHNQETYVGVLEGNVLVQSSRGGILNPVIPSPDGKYLFTNEGIFTPQLKPAGGEKAVLIPALQGDFYMHQTRLNIIGDTIPSEWKLRLLGSETPLLDISSIAQLTLVKQAPRSRTFSGNQRWFLIPAANVLVALPLSDNQVRIHRLDVHEALEKSGIDYLTVLSRPAVRVTRGKGFVYPIHVLSKKGGLKFRLDAAPDGMRVDSKGVVTWKVPADAPNVMYDIMLTIIDASGRETIHRFQLQPCDASTSELKK